jgi:hypothetical protein
VTSRVQRVDYFAAPDLAKAEETAEGFLRVDGRISRSGLLSYFGADGKEHVEYRPDDEVFDQASIDSFKLLPLTNNHPSTLLDTTTAKMHTVGAVGESVRRDGDFLRTQMLIHDRDAISAARAGRSQLSAGYSCELEFTPGVFGGRRYDAIQRNIRGNHVALVDVARAGPEARIRLDRMDARGLRVSGLNFSRKDENTMATKKKQNGGGNTGDLDIDNTEAEGGDDDELVDCDDCNATGLVDGEQCVTCGGRGEYEADDDAPTTAANARHGQMRNEQAEIDRAKAAVHGDRGPTRADAIQAMIRERVALELRARELLGSDAPISKLDNASVMRLAIRKHAPHVDVSGKPREYLRGVFDSLTPGESLAASPSLTLDSAAPARGARIRTDTAGRIARRGDVTSEAHAREIIGQRFAEQTARPKSGKQDAASTTPKSLLTTTRADAFAAREGMRNRHANAWRK